MLPALPLHAEIALRLADVRAQGWRASDVSLVLTDAEPGRYALQLRIGQLHLPDGEWRSVSLTCPQLALAAGYHCAQAELQADSPHGVQRAQGSFQYQDDEHWQLSFAGLRLAGGRWRLQAEAAGDWQAELKGDQAALAGLLGLLPAGLLPDWNWQGTVDAELRASGRGAEPANVDIRLSWTGGGYGSPDGLQAAQDVQAEASLAGKRGSDDSWQGRGRLSVATGQWYSDPVFLDLASHPLAVNLAGRWQPGDGTLALRQGDVRLGKLLSLAGQGRVLPLEKAQGKLMLELPDLAGLYPAVLQPLAYSTVFSSLEVAGGASLQLGWSGQHPQSAQLQLKDLYVDDQEGRFGISGLQGTVDWQAAAAGSHEASRLSWDGGHLYRIGFGASGAALQLAGDALRLTTPLSLPLLEGLLRVPRFEVTGLGSDAPIWWAALSAEALSLPALSAALQWPPLDGTLSVQIPAVSYAAGELGVDGELVARAFDGTVRVNGLRLTDPLGAVPGLQAEASLRGLDLEKLTRTFDLGRITGRLDGDVRELQLLAWQPVRFSAELRTPENDSSRHRISQRAVENLTALGNNGAAALSGTFLRFFESFAYDRLLLKVDLAGQRAQLDGIAHPDGGYYLVKGSGLPRIDVIGRNRQVAWRDLVGRLKRIRLEGMQMR